MFIVKQPKRTSPWHLDILDMCHFWVGPSDWNCEGGELKPPQRRNTALGPPKDPKVMPLLPLVDDQMENCARHHMGPGQNLWSPGHPWASSFQVTHIQMSPSDKWCYLEPSLGWLLLLIARSAAKNARVRCSALQNLDSKCAVFTFSH